MTAVEVPIEVRDVIRKARVNAGLDQEQLGEHVGVSRGTISNWERGQGEPGITAFMKIAAVCDAPWLVEWARGQNWKFLHPVAGDAGEQMEIAFTPPARLTSAS